MDETFNQREYFTTPAQRFGNTVQSQVQIFEEDGEKPVVVLTEIGENPGASVTNAAEFLAEQVRARFLGGREAVYVEHYPGNSQREETYDLVEFDQDGLGRYYRPRWRHLGLEGFKELVGEAVGVGGL